MSGGPYSVKHDPKVKNNRPYLVLLEGRIVLTSLTQAHASEQADLFNRMWRERHP